jgi:Icc-related predicted phosphoesterase
MTHEGPSGSSTAINTYFDEKGVKVNYHCGSPALTELLHSNRQRVVCDIHGHSHDGSFIQNIGIPREVLPVINPGSLGQNEYAEIVISKVNNKWKLTEANKIYLR